MIFKNSNYVTRLQLSFIAVLLGLILLFRLFPKFKPAIRPLPQFTIQQIQFIEIPPTVQQGKAPPPPLKPVIPVAGEEIEMLTEVPIEVNTSINSSIRPNSELPLAEEMLPYIPRQIVEVLPKVDDLKLKGTIILKLLIDKNGKIKKIRLISNSTQNPLAVKRVIQAVQKSRWEVVQFNQQSYEYWITKVYHFK